MQASNMRPSHRTQVGIEQESSSRMRFLPPLLQVVQIKIDTLKSKQERLLLREAAPAPLPLLLGQPVG